MMTWAQHTEDTLKAWADMQRKLQENWLKALESSTKAQPGDAWEQTVDLWEESVKAILDSQAECGKLWAESVLSLGGRSRDSEEWARRGQAMMKEWTETHKRLWEGWFACVKQLNWSGQPGTWEQEWRKVWQSWEDAVRKAVEVQTEWLRLWTTGPGEKTGAEERKG